MPYASKGLLWVTALTTASLAVTGCSGLHEQPQGAKVASAPRSEPSHRFRAPQERHSLRRVPPPAPSAPAPSPPAPSPADHVDVPRAPFLLVTSDGSSVVNVGGRPVRFPGPVTDATVSPNGMAVAFVGADGNIATARLDGAGQRVLTSTDAGVRRAHPTFEDGGSEIVFSERGHDGVWRLKEVAADGHDDLTAGKQDPAVQETRSDGGRDTSPSATWFQASHAESTRSVMVFEHRTRGGVAKVYLADRNQRGFGASALLTGRSPAVSPTGDQVAFIGSGGEIEVQTVPVPGRRPHPVRITWGAHAVGHLGWSPDGSRIVYSTRSDVETVASTPPGPERNPARIVLSHPGVGGFGTVARPVVGVYAHSDPVLDAVAVSRAHYVDGTDLPMDDGGGLGVSWATHVTLVSVTDASAAATAAATADGGPILFVRGDRLEPAVRDEIVRLLHHRRALRMPAAPVDIVGTTTAVPDSVAAEIRRLGLKVRRLSPEAAAAGTAAAIRGSYESYVVVSQSDLAGVVSAVGTDAPVLLTDGATMPAATAAKLDGMPHYDGESRTVYAVGQQAQAAVRSSWAGKRPFRIVDLGGADPLATSLAAVQGLYDAPGRLAVTTAGDWRESLIATMVGPTLVVDEGTGLGTVTRDWLTASRAAMRAVYVFGGSGALPTTVGQAVYGDGLVVTPSPTDIRD
jgi:Tol biopolymer transport system component